MMTAPINTGGPAFPEVKRVAKKLTRVSGMTLRDYFAAKAMQGMFADSSVLQVLSRGPRGASAELAAMAYEQADAMLKAREGGAA